MFISQACIKGSSFLHWQVVPNALQMNDKALLYAITFDRQDLLDEVDGIDTNLMPSGGK